MLTFLLGAAVFAALLLVTAQAARADDSVAMALNKPSVLAPRAQAGLFTSVARAGNRLVAVGEHGHILLSDDSGRSWRQVETPTNVTLTHVTFATPEDGWAVGQMGVVLASTDAGAHWVKQLDGMQANQITLAAAQADAAAKGNNATTAANLQTAEALAGGGPSVPFLDVLALSPTHLLLTGGFGLAMQSQDGGAHWSSILNETANPQGMHLYGITAVPDGLVLVGEEGLVLHGPAAGPFNAVNTPFAGTFFGALTAPDGTLAVYGLQGTILTSADAGAHWASPATGLTAGIDAGLVLQDGRLLFGDTAGDLLVSRDDAKSFMLANAGEPVAALVQAPDGTVIIGGPFGLRRLPSAVLRGA